MFLGRFVLSAVMFFAFFMAGFSVSAAASIPAKGEAVKLTSELEDYREYEKIVLKPWNSDSDQVIPDYRAIYLFRASQYEAFLEKYPNSLLVPEVKLRLAEIYKDVERPEVFQYRKEMYYCLETASGSSLAAREKCIAEFWQNIEGRKRDPAYTKKAIALFYEIIQNYGYYKRYIMFEPRHGGFRHTEEDAGGYALYILSKGASPKDRVRIYEVILKQFQVREEIKKEMEDFLQEYQGKH